MVEDGRRRCSRKRDFVNPPTPAGWNGDEMRPEWSPELEESLGRRELVRCKGVAEVGWKRGILAGEMELNRGAPEMEWMGTLVGAGPSRWVVAGVEVGWKRGVAGVDVGWNSGMTGDTVGWSKGGAGLEERGDVCTREGEGDLPLGGLGDGRNGNEEHWWHDNGVPLDGWKAAPPARLDSEWKLDGVDVGWKMGVGDEWRGGVEVGWKAGVEVGSNSGLGVEWKTRFEVG